jgi:hypothetical protein
MSRERIRAGRQVRYFPTTAEVSTYSADTGDVFFGFVTKANTDGTANLALFGTNGVAFAKTSVALGTAAGTFDLQLPG